MPHPYRQKVIAMALWIGRLQKMTRKVECEVERSCTWDLVEEFLCISTESPMRMRTCDVGDLRASKL